MDAQLVANLERIVSAPRLQRYRNASQTDLETTVLYCWNIQLAEALMPSIAIFEVTLRNAVHNVLANQAGSEWWFKPILQQKSYDNIVNKIITALTTQNGIPPTAGKVISEITFGFWKNLFAKHYNPVWLGPQPPFLLSQILPNHPSVSRDTRSKLELRLEYFHVMRNRIMHQEAIFDGVQAANRTKLPIEEVHAQLIETLAWIDGDAAALVTCLDRFNEVFDPAARQALEHSIRTRFQIP